ncbi:MAG TPA: hypothetical protein VNZ54_09085, partial [bacterium]|nr:hypothetical protein [bacterium]
IPTPLPGLWGTGTPPPTPYLGGRVRGPAAMAVASMGPSHTSTQTSTITHTFTATPTITCTPSASPTVTTTPPIAVDHGHFYCYPNPYDIRLRSQLTFRFPAASSASVEIMDLLGRPVAHLPQSDIYPSGFGPPGIPGVGGSAAGGVALWEGQDDYGEVVAGGLYFAVLKSPGGTQVLKFTILH